ncbi:MAG TPA: DUF4038 domain-containing protein [Myxococcales bacterium]
MPAAPRTGYSTALPAALAGLLAACHLTAHAVPPGLVSIEVRAPSPVRAVEAAAPGASSLRLETAGDGRFRGTLAVAPGPHAISLRALDGAGAAIARTTARVQVAAGDPAQIAAALGDDGGAFRILIASRTSLVAGGAARLEAGPPPISWSAAPPGCGRFAGERAPATDFEALLPGPCTVTAAAPGRAAGSLELVVRARGRSDDFPLRPAPDGRFLLTRRGTPFLVKGEAAWLAIANLTAAEQEAYLADRSARGFNLVEVMLVNHDYTQSPNPVPPANRLGQQPFLRAGELSTPNDAYFDSAAAFVDRAAAHGIAVLLAPLYLGFDGGVEGWWEALTRPSNTEAVAFAYGRYLGSRLKEKKNLIWLAGGDFAPPAGSEGERRLFELVRGIKEGGAAQPWTGHWNLRHQGGNSTDELLFAPLMDLNGVYQYANAWKYASRAYDAVPPRPAFLLESTYEREHANTDLHPFRKAWWWAMLSGGSGVLWGNTFLWMCESARGTYRATYGAADGTESSWSAELASPGTFEVLHLHAFFEAIPWQRLVPAGPAAGRPELVSDGQRGGDGHISSAATREGDLVVAYLPPTGTRPRRFQLDLSGLRRPGRLRWFDPSTGEFVAAPARLPAARGVELESPGKNGSGVNDWALVIDTPEPPR